MSFLIVLSDFLVQLVCKLQAVTVCTTDSVAYSSTVHASNIDYS